jgi:hypothetical protein
VILKNVSYSEQLAIEERMNAGRLGIKKLAASFIFLLLVGKVHFVIIRTG